MMLLHQISKVGGDILNKNIEYFGLFGETNVAIATKFKDKAILHTNEVELPCWATLSIVTTEDGVESAKDSNASPVFTKSAMSIPCSSSKPSSSSTPPLQQRFLWNPNLPPKYSIETKDQLSQHLPYL